MLLYEVAVQKIIYRPKYSLPYEFVISIDWKELGPLRWLLFLVSLDKNPSLFPVNF